MRKKLKTWTGFYVLKHSWGIKLEQEEVVDKFHDELGKLVFEAIPQMPLHRVISELEGIKILIEVQYVINLMNKQVKESSNKDIFDKMYG